MADAGRLRLVEQHTDDHGRLDVAALAALVPDLAERQTWACGPAGLLDAIEEQWADLGQPDRLHTERFRTAARRTRRGRHRPLHRHRHRRSRWTARHRSWTPASRPAC